MHTVSDDLMYVDRETQPTDRTKRRDPLATRLPCQLYCITLITVQ